MENRLSPEQVKKMGALGYRDQLTEEELADRHIDGLTGLVFETEEQYLDHKSPITGHTPKEVEHMGEEFVAVSEAASQRGKARKELEDKGMSAQEAKEATKDLSVEVVR